MSAMTDFGLSKAMEDALDTVPEFDVDSLVEWFAHRDTDPTIEEVEAAAARLDRNAYPALVAGLYYELWMLTPTVAAHVVSQAWLMCEFPSRQVDRGDWRELFDYAGFTVDGVRAPRRRPRKPRRLYRGAAPEHMDGWSWTEDRAQAQWFTDRFNFDGRRRLYMVDASPSSVLAIITGQGRFGRGGLDGEQGESEWIVDTDGLHIVKVDR